MFTCQACSPGLNVEMAVLRVVLQPLGFFLIPTAAPLCPGEACFTCFCLWLGLAGQVGEGCRLKDGNRDGWAFPVPVSLCWPAVHPQAMAAPFSPGSGRTWAGRSGCFEDH